MELKLKTENWILISCYRPPNLHDSVFTENITSILDKSPVKTDNILVLGDLNYNLLDQYRHGKILSDINDIFDMSCLLSKPTCFRGDQGTLLDVFLTNRPKKFYKSTSVETGISDFHHIIITVMKGSNQKPSQKYHTSRSYKKFDETKFLYDLNNDLATVILTLSDYENNCSTLGNIIKNVIDRHAPIKTRKIRNHSSPAMNGKWRRAI